MEIVEINTAFIKLDQLLKWAGVADSGSMAKEMIADGIVMVNREICLQRGKKIIDGNVIEISESDIAFTVKANVD